HINHLPKFTMPHLYTVYDIGKMSLFAANSNFYAVQWLEWERYKDGTFAKQRDELAATPEYQRYIKLLTRTEPVATQAEIKQFKEDAKNSLMLQAIQILDEKIKLFEERPWDNHAKWMQDEYAY